MTGTPRFLQLLAPSRIADLLLLFVLAAFILAGKDLAPFQGDESTFIRMSRDYKYLKEGNLERLLYRPHPEEGGMEQKIRLTTGSFNSFAIGLARDLAGLSSQPVNGFWLWDYAPERGEEMWEVNIQRGRMPDPESLRVSRIPSTVLGAATLFLFFLSARLLTQSRLAAWIGTVALGTSPLFLIHVRRAMQEGSKLFFLCLCLAIAARITRAPNKIGYLLLGIAGGITLACKQDVAMALAGIYTGLTLLPFPDKRNLIKNLLLVTASTCVALACFLALMPVWWGWWPTMILLAGLALLLFQASPGEPGTRRTVALLIPLGVIAGSTLLSPGVWMRSAEPIQLMIKARGNVMAAQIDYRVRNHLPYLDTPGRRLTYLARTMFSSGSMDRDSPRFNVPTREQRRVYEASWLSGRHGWMIIDVLVAALFAFGLWKTIRHPDHGGLLLLPMLVISAVILLLTTPLAFDRYFLVLQIPYTLLAGIGAQWGWTVAKSRWIRKDSAGRNGFSSP